MKHAENTSIYESDEGKMIIRVSDERIMGYSIELGANDSIDNYEEVDFTEEEIAAFWGSVYLEDPRKNKNSSSETE